MFPITQSTSFSVFNASCLMEWWFMYLCQNYYVPNVLDWGYAYTWSYAQVYMQTKILIL